MIFQLSKNRYGSDLLPEQASVPVISKIKTKMTLLSWRVNFRMFYLEYHSGSATVILLRMVPTVPAIFSTPAE